LVKGFETDEKTERKLNCEKA